MRESAPPIWRRVLVSGTITLADLHEVLQVLMDWEGYHLYEFEIAGQRYGTYEPEFAEEPPPIDARRRRLSTVVPGAGTTFLYIYDFGDDWRHDIVRRDRRRHYPLCIGGQRAAPPEDCGGSGGFYEMLRALERGDGEEYDTLLTWLGGDFDPDGFDRNAINRRLREMAEDS